MPINNEHQEIVEEPAEVTQDQTTNGTSEVQQEQEVEPAPAVEPQPLRRSTREMKTTVSEDFVYLSEGHDIGKVDDPNSFKEAMSSEYSHKWIEAMEEELKSMSTNKIWDLVEIPKGTENVGCNGSIKLSMTPKRKSNGSKQDLWLRDLHREGIDYIETFSPISKKDSFRIVMTLAAHFNLELHQMGIKTAFPNGDLHENVYMAQPEGFVMEGKE